MVLFSESNKKQQKAIGKTILSDAD